MKYTHITKAIAVVMTMIMLLSCVPSSVLPVFAADAQQSTSIFDNVTLGKGTVTNTENYNGADYAAAPTDKDALGNIIVNSKFSPYEPYSTQDENHPFLPGQAAWIDLKEIYYGVPATPNVPITKWSANTSVVNITGTGKKYTAGIAAGKEIYAIEDMNLIDEYLWEEYSATVGGNTENGVAQSPSESSNSVSEKGKFAVAFLGSDAKKKLYYYNMDTDKIAGEAPYYWQDQNGDNSLDDTKEIFHNSGKHVPFVYNVEETNKSNGYYVYVASSYTYNMVTSKNDTVASVYNRYDAMQGKWGLTLDKNVSSVVWTPSSVENYYGMDDSDFTMNNSMLYLSDTPYLFYSTEALDNTQIAISLLIGTPVQSERKLNDSGATKTYWDSNAAYEFRWYTITDNAQRPGIGNDTLDNSMVPLVTVSDVVLENFSLTGQASDVIATMATNNPDSIDPIKVAQNAGIDTETMYVNGAITGCIDFTQLLPMLMAVDSGREDIHYKVAQVRVDTKTKTRAAGDSAARINYLYFGPGQAAIYTPQSTVGNDVSGMNWMYAQNDDGIGDENPNYVGQDSGHYIGNWGLNEYSWECSYTNGWHNGQAVSITNTPNNPQLMTIDTYGKGYGELIDYDQYKTEMTQYYKDNGATQAEDGKWYYQDKPVEWLATFTKGSTDANSKIWKFTDANGKTQYLETEFSNSDKQYYIMVTVPIRKWVNVLGDSRKLTMDLTFLKEGKDVKSEPTFCFWGNQYGTVGDGHQKIELGVRYSNEDMIGVFGRHYYNVDSAASNGAALVDFTLGYSVIYNKKETDTTLSEFDWLASPYVYDRSVTDSTLANYGANYGINEGMVGYTYVSSIRFVMPVGAKISVQNMKGDGNSAGLNTYSTSGQIVSAYDGGTGVQPEINMDNQVTEKVVTNVNNGTVTMENGNTIKGTQSNSAAAYGPMLERSFYTTYDLLDTEFLNTAGNSDQAAGQEGQNQVTVYGQMWTTQKANLIVERAPWNWGTNDGITYEAGTQIPIYATISFPNTNKEVWGVTGVINSDKSRRIGYIKLSDKNGTYATATAGTLYKTYTYNTLDDFNAAHGGSNVSFEDFASKFLDELGNKWVISNFIGSHPALQDCDNNGANTADVAGVSHGYVTDGKDIYNASMGGVQLMFANGWRADGATTCANTLRDLTVISKNTTDMEISYTRKKNTSHNLSFGMTRTFDTPILLHTSNIHYSYPVFYYDFTVPKNITNRTSFAMALTLLIDGKPVLYSLDANDGLLDKATHNADLGGNMCGYFSFENIIEATENGTVTIGNKKYPKYSQIEVVSLSIYFWNAGAYTGDHTFTIRRAEIWQEEVEWLDEIISDNQGNETVGKGTSTNMAAHVKDSMNIISDAFYYGHNENNDGNITLSKGALDSDKGVNEGLAGYKFTATDATKSETVKLPQSQYANFQSDPLTIDRTVSYRKTNSNKGWNARIQADTNGDGKVNEEDDRYWSYDFDPAEDIIKANKAGNANIYEYHSALGHLRVWVPKGQTASVVFESDRSFNTQNYRYLYYSYSMRDAATGISAENATADRKGSGVSVAIKQQQNSSDEAYLESNGTWVYYPDGKSYWSDDKNDNREFNTVMNAALDLSTTQLDSVNQIVFYLRNLEADQAEFYINYIYLSNVPPTEQISEQMEKVQTQYYYMMDNTGGRYSARFPTIDNPTGQVSGTNVDNDRVNPIKITRGQLLSTGTYFNGERIYGYGGTASTNREFNESLGSEGFYEKTYGNDDNPNSEENGSMKNIFFYSGTSDDLNDINDYYTYKDRGRTYTYKGEDGTLVTETVEPDGKGDVYDMVWSFGRWFTGQGEGGLNILYIGDPAAPEHQRDDNFRENGVSGGLTRRYATENYVLLRSGIEPVMYTTYYDANGGEFIYEDSPDYIENLSQVTENNYYITNDYILEYFNHPASRPAMKGENDYSKCIQKPGYKFSHWEHYTDYGTKDENFNMDAAAGEGSHFKAYIKKSKAGYDYFKAVWVADTEKYPADQTYTAKFLDESMDEDDPFRTRVVGYGHEHTDTGANGKYGRFVLTIPNATLLYSGLQKKPVYGWTIKGDDSGYIYSAGQKVYLLEDTVFLPVLDANAQNSFTITLEDATLWVKTDDLDENGNNKTRPAEFFGITATTSGNTTKYVGVQENLSLVAKPNTKTDGYGWTESYDSLGNKIHVIDGTTTVLSDNNETYAFTAHENISIAYSKIALNDFYDAQSGVYVTTSPRFTSAEQNDKTAVYFTSKYEAKNGYKVLAVGTLITKDAYYDTFTNADAQSRLDSTTVTEATIAKRSYKPVESKAFKLVQATATSANGEYTAYIAHTKDWAITYYARAYVIYKESENGPIKIAYSDVVAWDVGSPKTSA